MRIILFCTNIVYYGSRDLFDLRIGQIIYNKLGSLIPLSRPSSNRLCVTLHCKDMFVSNIKKRKFLFSKLWSIVLIPG
jgi:hypothetical protein